MMDFSSPPVRQRSESIVPMINVVFLLLIFFLMTSNLAKPEPFEVTPPSASSKAEPRVEHILYVDKSGKLSFEGDGGETALRVLAAKSEANPIIQLRADARLDANLLARLLKDLTASGLSRVELIVTTQ